jgi:hypothetical protein
MQMATKSYGEEDSPKNLREVVQKKLLDEVIGASRKLYIS